LLINKLPASIGIGWSLVVPTCCGGSLNQFKKICCSSSFFAAVARGSFVSLNQLNMSGKLSRKVAVITGGSSGIGLATAKLFVREGAKVVITGRSQDRLDSAIKEISQLVTSGEDRVIGIPADVAKVADLEYLFKKVHSTFGKIDVLISNAAAYAVAPAADVTELFFDKLSDSNFKGTFFTVTKALPYLNEGASVILTSTTVAEMGVPNHSVYAASKAAVRSLARSLTVELLDRRIRVNVLSPGPVETPIFEQIASSKEEAAAMLAGISSHVPVKRVGLPEEIASAALYLASDDSAYMAGSELLLDGGMRSI
jgi:NAD(P)-dependent dehydrogenase (short-subunit alcohol dehydrogenase family)